MDGNDLGRAAGGAILTFGFICFLIGGGLFWLIGWLVAHLTIALGWR